jgi:UrcA family protein
MKRTMKMATQKTILSCSLFAGMIWAAVPAAAEPRVIEVQYNDLDLSNTAGQQELQSRIKRAVKNVCRSEMPMNLSERRLEAKCKVAARNNAMTQADMRIANYRVNNPRVASARLASNED